MYSASNKLSAKRSLPSPDHHLHFKRARLEYILCDSGHGSIFSVPLPTVSDNHTTTSHTDTQSDLTTIPQSPADLSDLDAPPSPCDAASVADSLSEHCSIQSPSSTRTAHSLAAHLIDKYTKSRAVGQSHRDNERAHVRALRVDVENCRTENILLFALFSASYKLDHCKPLPLRLIADVHARLAKDVSEDYHVLTELDARTHGFIKLSASTSYSLEQRYISPALAVVLLDFVTYRRNVVPVNSDTADSAYRRRKRRSAFRVALSMASAQDIVDFAVAVFVSENRGEEHLHHYIDRRLGSLAVLLETWSRTEASANPPEYDSASEQPDFPPASPTRPEAAEFGSPPRRRGERAKRCSRCNMIKFTGSGHGRSKCDDGYSISSKVPYRPIPSSPQSECTSTDDATETSLLLN